MVKITKVIEEIVVEVYRWNIGRLDNETGGKGHQDSVLWGFDGGLRLSNELLQVCAA
jgi:hypothetical protein